MGGEGSGRKPSVETMIKRSQPVITPAGSDIFLPNYSGIKDAAKKTSSADITGGGGGAVDSVFTRIGDVVAVADDYSLDLIGDPAASKTFNFVNNKSLVFTSTDNTPAVDQGVFNFEAKGAFSGDLVHIHQHTGNPGATNLLRLEAEDADVVPLSIAGIGTYDIIAGDVSLGNIITSGTVDGVDIAALDTEVTSLSGAYNTHALSGAIHFTEASIDTDNITEGSTNLFSQWSTSGANVYRNTGNVGIGTTSPAVGLHLGSTATGHSLSSATDAIISGKLEVDGETYLDSKLHVYHLFELIRSSGRATHTLYAGTSQEPTYGLDTGTKQLVLTTSDLVTKGFDHGGQTNPTLFIQSATNPDTINTQWLSLAHDQTNAVFGLGIGAYTFPDGNVGIGTTGPSGKLHVSGGQVYIQNTTEPATPTNAGAIFISGAALYYKGGSGTVTKIANA